MNRSAVSVALVFVMSLAVMALTACQPTAETNRNADTATATPAKPAFDAAAIQAEVLQTGRDWIERFFRRARSCGCI